MTAQQLNAEMLRNMSIIAEDESLLKRVAKYLRKVVAEKAADPTLMSKEEFYASLERGMDEYKQGKSVRLQPNETVSEMLRRTGLWHINYLYPNGPIRIYWGANYYDKTDLIFYVIIVPLGIYALIKLYSIYKSKKSA